MTSFSVVITVYNGARFIPDALASVFGQTHAAHEVIVVNDGSTDNSLEILKEYGNRIRIADQPNAGVGSARNAGIRKASGDFVAFLDMDDYWRADKLEIFDRVVRHSTPHEPTFMFSDFVRENYFTKERLPSNTELNPWLFEHLEPISASDAAYVTRPDEAFRSSSARLSNLPQHRRGSSQPARFGPVAGRLQAWRGLLVQSPQRRNWSDDLRTPAAVRHYAT